MLSATWKPINRQNNVSAVMHVDSSIIWSVSLRPRRHHIWDGNRSFVQARWLRFRARGNVTQLSISAGGKWQAISPLRPL